MIAFGTISGGAGAALTGGNFWQGAVTGLVVSGLNHLEHAIKQKTILEIVYKRTNETENSTTGSFYIEGTDLKGYFIEPSGPSTTESNLDKRIPSGKYFLKVNPGKKYGLLIYNSKVPESRAVLIHIGNYPNDTVGCLLPGKTLGVDFVGNSASALRDIMDAYNTFTTKFVELRLRIIDIKK